MMRAPLKCARMASSLDAAHLRHRDVHQRHVGAEGVVFFDRLAAVGRFSHQLHVGLATPFAGGMPAPPLPTM